MSLLIILGMILYFNRRTMRRFYNHIYFYFSFALTFFLLGALTLSLSILTKSWFAGVPLIMAVAWIAGTNLRIW